MIVLHSQCRVRTPGVLAWCLCCVLLAPRLLADGNAAQHTRPTGRWRDATLEDYQEHVSALAILTRACAKSRDLKTCDPTLVGPDDRVTLSTGVEPRLQRYGWLRVLFSHAEEPDKADAAPHSQKPAPSPGEMTLPPPPTTSQLLDEAQVRLAHDLAQAKSAPHPSPTYADERAAMRQVLAGREFRSLEQSSEEDSALERFGNWLNRIFASVGKLRAHSAWIGRALVCGFIAIVGVALAWGLMQLERRWRVRLVPAAGRPLPTPPQPATGNCGLTTRTVPLQNASGATRFTSSIGPQSRGWSRGDFGPLTVPALPANTCP